MTTDTPRFHRAPRPAAAAPAPTTGGAIRLNKRLAELGLC